MTSPVDTAQAATATSASAPAPAPAVPAPAAGASTSEPLTPLSSMPLDAASTTPAGGEPSAEGASAEGATHGGGGVKRKPDKQARRAAAKASKKSRRAEWLRGQREMQQQEDEQFAQSGGTTNEAGAAPEQTEGNPNGTQARQGQVTRESVRETDYFFADGLRIAYPYWYEFSTYAKRRWLGRSIVDVMQGEFGNGGLGMDEASSAAYYRTAVESGALRISGVHVGPSHVMREGDHMQHYLHRHETPVSSAPLLVRYEDARLLLLDKPSSIPVHPCGNYRHNTVLYILAKERALTSLFVVHRLDAVTSGLLLLAKDARTARTLSQHISDKHVRKQYVARVQGHFPEQWQQHVLSAPIYQLTHNGQTVLSTSPPDLSAADQAARDAAAAARPKSDQPADERKESTTVFSFISYDPLSNTSIVQCCPLTGRTHQIRLHLQHLGYPIANDVRYGGLDASSSQPNDLAASMSMAKGKAGLQSEEEQKGQEGDMQVDDAAASSASEDASALAAARSFSAASYWKDPAARKQQLANESESARLARIRAESVDHSGGCPVCLQAKRSAGGAVDAEEASKAAAAVAAAPAVTQSAGAMCQDACATVDSLSSPFSSTRVRVEFIWLHAYKYSYDPSFQQECIDAGAASPSPTPTASPVPVSSSAAASSAPPAACWSYEIPWPSWALEIVPPQLREEHQQVRVQAPGVRDGAAPGVLSSAQQPTTVAGSA